MGCWQRKADELYAKWRLDKPRFSSNPSKKIEQLYAEVKRRWNQLGRMQPDAYNRGEWNERRMWEEFFERGAELCVMKLAPEIWKAWRADELRREDEARKKPRPAAVLPYEKD